MRSAAAAVILFATAAGAAPTKDPPLPAPDVSLQIEPRLATRFRVTITNKGSSPLRLVADVRLLRLTIESVAPTDAKKKKKPETSECTLPASMRGDDVLLTLPPGSKWVDEFDVRLHCLDLTEKLVEGATVTARFGWSLPKNAKLAAPFAVQPTTGDVAAAKEIVAAPIVLSSNVMPAPAVVNGAIAASGGGARSLGSGKDVDATIVLRNVSGEAKTLYARPQLVEARVINPRGQETPCNGPSMKPAPIIDFATKLANNGTWQATVSISHLCPDGTFDRPGLYQILPSITLPKMPQITNEVSGVVASTKPQLVRIETGSKPFYDAAPTIAKP